MQVSHRSLLSSLAALLVVSGCDINSPWGSSSSGTAYGAASLTGNTGGTGGSGTGSTTSPKGGVGGESGTTGTDDTIVATPSSSSVSVAVGSSQTASITFTSSDGRSITGFGVSGTLGLLPAGWSGPTTFTCKLVMAGSACVLNLTYAPTAPDSGSFVVNYVYVDNANLSKAPGGSVTISYQAIPQNNVVATAMPSGQINALVGSGVQSVSVNFSSDTNATLDAAITHLTLTTNLTALPAGWSATSAEAAQGFSCAIVTTGNGCELLLSYQPTAAGSGVLTLNYTYVDDSGASRSGSLNIPYATTSSNNVVATSSPAGQIIAVEKTGSQAVAIDFNTDDGGSASGLVLTSNLSALPAGWHSGATSFSCGTVSTGNGCRLALTYAPTALGSGMLALTYAYDDDAGNQQTGSLNVPYAATTNDNVVATASPSGQINAVVGQGPQNVGVAFTTDDTRLATALQVTSDLTMLPAGWSGPGTFTCSTVSTGSGCLLNLSYTPTGYATPGTLMVAYSYVDNAGQTKSGTVSIPYRATTNDTIAGTPSQPSLAIVIGSPTPPTPVTVTFATSDGNPAIGVPSTSNALTVTSGLNPLPPGWSASSTTFSCLTVSDGTVCQLPLSYAPTAVTNGVQTLMLGYSYVNDAGFANTGTASISYRAMSNNSVQGAANPSSLMNVSSGSTATVTVSFTTSDGNPATSLTISAPSPLPAGWSLPSPPSCATVNGSAATCQLTLTYQPLAPAGGTLQLGYSYINNAGQPGTGTLPIPYSAI
jgi:hypothetical protein